MGVSSLNEDWMVRTNEKYIIYIADWEYGLKYRRRFIDGNIGMVQALGGIPLPRICVKYPNKVIKEFIKCCIAGNYSEAIRVDVERIPSLDSNYPEKINIELFISGAKMARFELIKK